MIYVNGIPMIKDHLVETEVNVLESRTESFSLSPPASSGEDCLRLKFGINSDCNLEVEGIDLRTGVNLGKKGLGLVS